MVLFHGFSFPVHVLTQLLYSSRARVEIGLIAPFALDALQHRPTASTGAETTAVRQPFIVSSQQYMAHGGVVGQQRPLRPLEVRTQGRRRGACTHGMLYYHPYILRGTRALLPHTTHMIYCCNHQTRGRTLAIVSCPYEPVFHGFLTLFVGLSLLLLHADSRLRKVMAHAYMYYKAILYMYTRPPLPQPLITPSPPPPSRPARCSRISAASPPPRPSSSR